MDVGGLEETVAEASLCALGYLRDPSQAWALLERIEARGVSVSSKSLSVLLMECEQRGLLDSEFQLLSRLSHGSSMQVAVSNAVCIRLVAVGREAEVESQLAEAAAQNLFDGVSLQLWSSYCKGCTPTITTIPADL